MSDLAEAVLADISRNHRTFLPGPVCSAADVRRNLEKSVLLGGLTIEERALMLSSLPRDTSRLWLEPLDKGLSGSKVFQAKYERAGAVSKPFVMKVGPSAKIDREAEALSELVAPSIRGIPAPVVRIGPSCSLVIQEFASLSDNSDLQSLRTRVRESDDGPALVRRVLQDRLGPWYFAQGSRTRVFELGELFEWYLSKAPTLGPAFPPPWEDFLLWVETETNSSWHGVEQLLDSAISARCELPVSVVHGDLHTQNVLVDELGECWVIDFGWTREDASPLLDVVMLECSLKFLALPMRSDLRSILHVEAALSRFESVDVPSRVPYGSEARRIFETVQEVRRFAIDDLGIATEAYMLGLFLMTFALASHPGLNTPYMIASLQMMASVE